MTTTTVLLVGHGTRDPAGQAEFKCVVQSVQERIRGILIRAAFLELADPSISKVLASTELESASRLLVVPLVLFAARHFNVDIPNAVHKALKQIPLSARPTTIDYAPPLGCEEELLEISTRHFHVALGELADPAAHQPHTLFVGRGGSDATAIDAARRFTERRRQRTPGGTASLCFAAIQTPSVSEALSDLETRTAGLLIVQPHLLFRGSVLSSIHGAVQAWASRNPSWKVGIARHLAACPTLVELIEKRIRTMVS